MLSFVPHAVLCLYLLGAGSLGLDSALAISENQPSEMDSLPSQWHCLAFDEATKVSVVSPESRRYGEATLHSLCLSKAQFHLDEQNHLTAVLHGSSSPIAPGYRGRAQLHLAVFDKAQRLLGTAQLSTQTGGYWITKPIHASCSFPVDFGISKVYKDACFFAATITETPETPATE